jgi:predicted SnoaL-like aldol condensation-catalyzing enzyme
MAAATLNDVIKTMQEEGKQTRDTGANSLRVAIDSLNMTVNALGNINNSLRFFTEAFLENMKRSRREALLANNDRPELLALPENQSGAAVEDKVAEDTSKKKGIFGGIAAAIAGIFGAKTLGGLFKSISTNIFGGLKEFFGRAFKPSKIIKLLVRLVARLNPITAIVSGIIAALSGAISSFFESDKETLLGRIGDGILGAVGQVIEFFSFGFIKKEKFVEFLQPLTDFIDDAGVWILKMIEQPEIALDKAIAAFTRVGIWISDFLGDIWESLGLDDLTKVLFGTKVSGKMVSKFFQNLFSPKPEEGYFSIVKLLIGVWDTSKKAVETTASNVSKFFTNLFSSTPEDGYFSIAKVLSDLFTAAKTTLIAGTESVSKFFSSLFSLSPAEGYFSIAKVLSDLFTSAKTTLIAGKESVSKFFSNLFAEKPQEGYFSVRKVLSDLFTAAKTTLIAGKESVSKFFTNLFAEKPEEGYFSIRKVLSDLFTNAKTTLLAGKDTVVKIFSNLFSSAPEDGYFSVVKMVIDAFNSVSNLAETFYTKVQNLVAENIVDPIGNAFTSAGRFMSSLPDRIMLTIEEIWVKTMANLKIGFIKFADFITLLPKRIELAARELLYDKSEGLVGSRKGLDEARASLAEAGKGSQANIDAITAKKAADLEAIRLKKAALDTDAITPKKDTDLEAAQLKKAALDKDAQAATPVIVSKGGDTNYMGDVYNGPVTSAPTVNQGHPGGYSSQLPTQQP